jgi:hypothetical protein
MKRYYRLLIFCLLILVVTLFAFISNKESDSDSSPSMRGLCWVAGDSIAQHNITQITDIGTNWISQTPFGWMSSYDSPEVVLSNEKAWWGETDRGVIHTAQLAKASGVKTMLKPHIWLRRSKDKWRSDIAMNSDEEWDMWFESYSDWILHYAKVAEDNEIEALCIGTELYQTTSQHPDKWKAIIKDIRKIYSGKLIYAANWYKEYEEITFWGDLDYIGIQAYFPLSKKENPSHKDLIKSWSKHKIGLEKISKKYDKKIVFTEIGYKNTIDSAKEPWTWPQDMGHSVQINENIQSKCYAALFESFWHEPWFDGLFIWKWFHSTHNYTDFDTYFAARFERRKARAKNRNRELLPQAYFTPQKGGAIDLICHWYLTQ